MKSNNFGYLLKEGIRGIFLHGFMSFAAVCVTVACLVIIGSFSVLLYNLNIMVAEVEQDAEILVYIDETYTEAEAKSVGFRLMCCRTGLLWFWRITVKCGKRFR